jgi:hypothetical protein
VIPDDIRDGDMLVLVALFAGEGMTVAGDAIMLTLDGQPEGAVPLEGDQLDRLEGRGWVVVEERGPALTDKGLYWLQRWMKEKAGLRGSRRVELTGANVRRARA